MKHYAQVREEVKFGSYARGFVFYGPDSYRRFAEAHSFRQEIIEKVVRLGQILAEVNEDEFLAGRLALKGGTAINLIAPQIRRLSVDLDFNYIGEASRDAMVKEKPFVEGCVEAIAAKLGYDTARAPESHAGSKFDFRYANSLGLPDLIRIDLNWLDRVPMGPLQNLKIWQPEGVPQPEVTIVCAEELIAGKLRALVDRSAARDVFDAAHLPDLLEGDWPSAHAMSLFVFYAGTLNRPLTDYKIERIDRLTEQDYENNLVPVLSLGQTRGRDELISRAKTVLSPMLSLDAKQREYVERLQVGEFLPELVLAHDQDLTERLREHPALLWKAQNARDHRKRKRESG